MRAMHALDEAIPLDAVDVRMRYFFALGVWALALLPLIPLAVVIVKTGSAAWFVPCYGLLTGILAFRHGTAAHARFGYALLDDGLWLQSGVTWRKAAFVPRARIQHAEVSHGPLDRHMGLAKLVVYTAGIRTPHLTVPGLTQATADQLRDALLRRAQEYSPAQSMAVDAESTPAPPPADTATKSAMPASDSGGSYVDSAPANVDLQPQTTPEEAPPAPARQDERAL
jgi:uncharacterized protein